MKISSICDYLEQSLRKVELAELYYVYLPDRDKPKYIHTSYQSALREAQRLKALLEKDGKIRDEEIQILQIIKKYDIEIPF